MKINYKEIENVKYGSFTYKGEKWTLANYDRNQGTSKKGLWNDMTNGSEIVRVYKKDVGSADKEKAVALFNGSIE